MKVGKGRVHLYNSNHGKGDKKNILKMELEKIQNVYSDPVNAADDVKTTGVGSRAGARPAHTFGRSFGWVLLGSLCFVRDVFFFVFASLNPFYAVFFRVALGFVFVCSGRGAWLYQTCFNWPGFAVNDGRRQKKTAGFQFRKLRGFFFLNFQDFSRRT